MGKQRDAQATLERPAPNECKIISVAMPHRYKQNEATGELICDGFEHTVVDKSGKQLGKALTKGLALQIARGGSSKGKQE